MSDEYRDGDPFDALRADAHEVGQGRLSRQQFLRRGLGLGLSLPALGFVLSACGAGTETSSGDEAVRKAPEKLTGPLAFVNWAEWIGPGELKGFRRKTKVEVKQSFFTNNEELLAKLRASRGSYDVAVPGTNAVEILRKTDGLEKLNLEWLPSTKSILPRFVKQAADPQGAYAVANDWSFHGIGVRADKVSEDITSWEDLWRYGRKYRGRITVLDGQREVIGTTLMMLGHDYNSTDAKEIAEAGKMLEKLKPNLLAITSGNQREQLLSGQAYLTTDWNYSVVSANREKGKSVQFTIPEDGTGYYADYLVIPKGAKNLYSAHRFIDFLHEPANYAKFVEFTGTPWTNGNVESLLPRWMATNHWLDPPESTKLTYQRDVGDATPLYGEAWTRFKSA